MRSVAPFVLLLLAGCGPASAPAPLPEAAPAAANAAATEPPPVAAAAAPTMADPAQAQVLLSLSCRGAAPDWSLEVRGDSRATLHDDSGDLDLEGDLATTAVGHTYRAAPADAPAQTVAMLVTPVACFPPGGGNALPLQAELSFADGRHAGGCCRGETGLDVRAAGEFAAADATDWSHDLPRTIDYVERCALDAGVDARAAIDVRDAAGGKLVVRLRDSDDARFDCLIDPQQRDIEAVAPVTAAGDDPVSSEWLPVDPDELPRLDCGKVYRDVAADGRLRGWVHDRHGC